MLLGVLVSARPDHLTSSLAYMQHFAFGAPPYMRDSLEVLREAADLAAQIAVARIPWRRLRTELRLEDVVRMAEAMRRPSMAEEADMVDWRSRNRGLDTHWKVCSSFAKFLCFFLQSFSNISFERALVLYSFHYICFGRESVL